jgi:hypothetical protein
MDISDPHDPVARAIRDVIDMEGGPPVPQTLGAALINDDFLHALVSMNYLEERLAAASALNGGANVSVHFTRSTSMRPSVERVAPQHLAVIVPIGVLARLQVMHRLLLTNWEQEERPTMASASIMDRTSEVPIPSGLTPLLGNPKGVTGEREWWDALDALNAEIDLAQGYGPDVSELNHLALSLLLSHEFAHVARHHIELRDRVRAGELAFEVGHDAERRPGTDIELLRAMENDADMVAAYLTVQTLLIQATQARHDLPLGFTRFGYALTALMALFDPYRVGLSSYGKDGRYAHPLVRYFGYHYHSAECARQTGFGEEFEISSDHGARKCLTSLNTLEFLIFTERRFCAPGETPQPAIHALRGSRANVATVGQEQQNELALALRLGTLITENYGEFRF